MHFINGDIDEFRNAVNGKKLVCFGAGQALRNFIEEYAQYHLEQNICCIADNKSEQMEPKVQIANAEIPVISVRQFLAMKNIIILISCRAIYDVYEQLNSYPELEETCCWATNFVRSETNARLEQARWYPTSYRLTQEPLIPKKIHYCWFGGKPIPEKNKRWMSSWRKYCPEYEIIRWDESNYDVTKNTYMYEAYKAEKWGFVPDYARLDIIYHYGGIYLDTDVELVKSLDELLYQKAFMGIDGTRKVSLGLGFGAQPGCEMIKELKEGYDGKKFLNEDGSCNLIAAPRIQSGYFRKKGFINNGEYQVIGDVTVYPEKVLSAKCIWTGRILPTEHTFAIHHYDGSWTTEEMKAMGERNRTLFRKIAYEKQRSKWKENLLVSVLIPVYHAERYLKEAIDSILNQTYTNLEILVLYDDSEDGTLELLKEYMLKDVRIKVTCLPHKGIANALNTGLELAKGKYIARMDADDVSLPDRIAVQVEYMEEHPDIGVCGTQVGFLMADGRIRENKLLENLDSEDIKTGMLFQCMMMHPTIMFRRDVVESGNWRYDTFVQCEDFELWSRMIRSVKFANISETLLYYRHNQDSLTKTNTYQVFESSCEIMKKNLEYILKVDTQNYKWDDFRGLCQGFQLNEPIGDNFRRQNKLLHEIYQKNQNIKFCKSEYLIKYIGLVWESQFDYFGIREFYDSQDWKINYEERDCDFHDGDVRRLNEIVEWFTHEMAVPKNVIVYGAGIRGERLLKRWADLSCKGKLAWNLIGVADKRKVMIGWGIEKMDCMRPEEILGKKYDYILISTHIYFDEIREELISLGVLKEKILDGNIFHFIERDSWMANEKF